MKPLTYLVCPYSSPDESVRNVRFEAANKAAAYLIRQGYNVFSPISHSVPIAQYLDNHNDSGFWVEMDLAFIGMCQSVHVLMIDGWLKSVGVIREFEEAQKLGLEIIYLDWDQIK